MFVGLARTIYILTIYDRIFDEIPAKITIYVLYIRIYMVLANPTYLPCVFQGDEVAYIQEGLTGLSYKLMSAFMLKWILVDSTARP